MANSGFLRGNTGSRINCTHDCVAGRVYAGSVVAKTAKKLLVQSPE